MCSCVQYCGVKISIARGQKLEDSFCFFSEPAKGIYHGGDWSGGVESTEEMRLRSELEAVSKMGWCLAVG